MRKKFIIVITAIFTLFSFACADTNPAVAPNPTENPQAELSSYDVADSEKVTYCIIGFDPAYYNVYIFTEESFSHYDYTHYWVGSKDGLDYFNGTAPVGEEYLVDEGPMSEEVWIDIKKALTDGKFKKLPEDLRVDDIYDGAIYEIEVLDDSERYFSGGYMAGYGNGIQQKRFNDIRIAFDEAVSECEEYLKNPPKPEVENTDESESTEADVETENESYTPSYNVFADIPDHEGIYDYYSSDGSVFIRQDLNTHKSYINDNGNWIEFNDIYELATGAYGPRIEKFDYDGDGEEDYLIAECEGSGTGFSVYGLVIFKKEGNNGRFENHDYTYFVNMIDENITYNYNDQTNELRVYEVLPPYFNRAPESCTITLDSNKEFENITYSDIIDIYFEDGKIYMSAPIGCNYKDIPYPDYDNTIRVTAELHINDDLSLTPIWYITHDSQE